MKIALLGRKLGHSYSRLIHMHFGLYDYELMEKEPEDVLPQLDDGAYAGYNVTIPYKETVIPRCARLSPLAATIGAVNTLYRDTDGSWLGDNTDAYGMTAMLERAGISPRGQKCLILGSGGTSKTAQYVLRQMGAKEVIVVSRSGTVNYDNAAALHGDAGFIMNTTPVGMYPNMDASPIDLTAFPKAEAAADVIYNPLKTRFILQAEALGMKTVSGLSMLVLQAARAAERFTGEPLPEEKVMETLHWLEEQI